MIAVGRDGLWRLRQFGYHTSKQTVAKALEDEACVLQAEEEGFFMVELEVGNFITLALDGFIITVNAVYRCVVYIKAHKSSMKGSQVLAQDVTFTGKVEYQWEMKRFLSPDWAPIDLPKWTCLLFVDEVGKYRCNFESTAIVEVEHSPQVKHSKSNG